MKSRFHSDVSSDQVINELYWACRNLSALHSRCRNLSITELQFNSSAVATISYDQLVSSEQDKRINVVFLRCTCTEYAYGLATGLSTCEVPILKAEIDPLPMILPFALKNP